MEKAVAIIGVIFDVFAYVFGGLFRFLKRNIGWVLVIVLAIVYFSMPDNGEEKKSSATAVKEMSETSDEQIGKIALMLEQMKNARKQVKMLFVPATTSVSSSSETDDKDYSFWLSWANDKKKKILFEKAEKTYGFLVDAELGRYPGTKLTRDIVFAMIAGESGCNPEKVGDAGEIGLMQIKPSTAKPYGFSREDLFDPAINIHAGIRYLIELENNLSSVPAALVGYNSGETGAKNKFASNPGKSLLTYDYVEKMSSILEVSGRKVSLL